MSGSEVAGIAGAVIAVLGGLVAIFGTVVAINESRARGKAVHTTGVVLANVYGRGHALSGQPLAEAPESRPGDLIQFHSREMGFPKVEFTTAAGETIAFTSSVGSRPLSHKVGDTVPVYYDAAHPSRAEIAGEGTFLTVFAIVFGIVMAGIGIAIRTFS